MNNSSVAIIDFQDQTNLSNIECVIRSGGATQIDFFHFLIYGVFLNCVGILGLIGNVISITILSRPNMRSSINCCLVGLASFDSILLTTSLLMFGILAIPEYTGSIIWYQKDVFPWVTLGAYPLGIVAQTGSIYLTVTVTVERYVAVCHPLKARSLCTYGRAKTYVMAVAFFSLLYNLPRFLEVTYKFCDDDADGFTVPVMTEMRQRHSYIQIYITWMYLVVMYLFPFLSLLVFNIFIYKQVRLANHERQRLSRLQKKELGLAVMLLCVVVVFFLCNILAFICNILEMFGIASFAMDYLTMINNLLVTVNSSVNFIIYCIFGQKFRRLFLQMFCFGVLNNYIGADIAFLESGAPGGSIYGDQEGRQLSCNGRSQNTRRMHLSSWNNSQVNKNVHYSNTSWSGKREMITGPNRQQYKNIPAHENSEEIADTKSKKQLTKENAQSVTSITNKFVENIEEISDSL